MFEKEKIKLIFIDIDNTLLDFDEAVKKALKEGFTLFHLKEYEPWMYDVFHTENMKLWHELEHGKLTFEELKKKRFNKVFEALNIDFDGVVFEEYFRSQLMTSAIPVEHSYEMLSYLNKKYLLSVASNGPHGQQYHRLDLADMNSYFTFFIDSESAKASKPNKAFFDYAFSVIHEKNPKIIPSDCLMFGDSLTSDMKGGRDYGIHTLFYNKHHVDISNEEIEASIDDLLDVKKYL